MSMPDQNLPPLNALIAFDAAYRHRNFTRAAAELHLTQASVSRLIRQVEDALETRLFERGRRDVAPTPAGDVLADTVRRVLAELSLTAARLRAEGRSDRQLTVFAELGLASGLIAPNIGAFQRRHPDISIRIVTSAEPVEAFDPDCDLGLRSGAWNPQTYRIVPVADDAIYPVCGPDFLARLPQPPTPEQVAAGPLLHWEEAGGPWPDWPDFLGRFGVNLPRPAPGPRITAYEVLLDFAEKTDGFALAWARSAQDRIAAGRLARVPGMTLSLPGHTSAHFPKRRPPNPVAEEFVALLTKNAPTLDI